MKCEFCRQPISELITWLMSGYVFARQPDRAVTRQPKTKEQEPMSGPTANQAHAVVECLR